MWFFHVSPFSNGEFSRVFLCPYSGGFYDFEPQRLRELHSKNQQRCHDAMEWLASKKNPIPAATKKFLAFKKTPPKLLDAITSPLNNDGFLGRFDPADPFEMVFFKGANS